jgi:predicted transcriptional regulator of viral defense system
MALNEFFSRHPVFTLDELTRFLAGRGSINRHTRNSLLSYHRRRGRIVSVRRGLYASIPPGSDPNRFPVDPYLLASKMAQDAVLAYHTALDFHGRAYSVWEHFIYMAPSPPSPMTFRSNLFRGVAFPQALRRKGKELFEVERADRLGLDVRVTSLERTLVDVLDRPHLAGGWEEIWRSLESVEYFDLDKVVEYTLLLDNATTAAKVGFYLEQHRESLTVGDAHLKILHDYRPQQPHYMDRSNRKACRLINEWNLVVPLKIVKRSWMSRFDETAEEESISEPASPPSRSDYLNSLKLNDSSSFSTAKSLHYKSIHLWGKNVA